MSSSKSPLEAASGPTAAPPKDPKPSVDRIDELARRILTGDILLPKFQRTFVWERPQILMLLDSVARGYPIGSVLLWQSRHELRSENHIAGLDIELPRPDYPVNYLLDGQQRLSAICGAMFWKGEDAASRWNIAYDLREQAFVHLDTVDDPPLHQVRINKLADPATFFKHVASLDSIRAPDKHELRRRAEDLFNRFKDYKIATVTLGDMSIQDVAPIFERVNSTGTALTIVDLMRAATWSLEFDLIDAIDGLLGELKEKNFEKVDRKAVLRNLSASTGGGFSVASIDQLRHVSAEGLRAAANDTTEAYKRAVDFLTTQIRVPGAEVVPYVNQIVVLAEIFRRVPTPSAAQHAAITHWFWKTALSGYFGGWNTAMMSDDLAALKSFGEGAPSIALAAPQPGADLWKTRAFRANSAHSKLLAIVLAHQSPVDLLTGQSIDTVRALTWSNVKEYHHFFPQAYLALKGSTPNQMNALANIVLLTSTSNKVVGKRPPSEYLRDVEKAAGPRLEKWLASNLISPAAFEAAKKDNFELFLAERSKSIHAAVIANTDWPLIH